MTSPAANAVEMYSDVASLREVFLCGDVVSKQIHVDYWGRPAHETVQ